MNWASPNEPCTEKSSNMTCEKTARRCAIAVLFMLLSGCYSFVGTNLSPDVKTFQIKTFPNYAENVNPDLSPALTNTLRDHFQTNTTLSLTNKDGDIVIEGEITGYQITPTANSASDQAAQSQLTVTVKVRYFNKYDKEQNFEKSYTESANFDRSQSLLEAAPALLKTIDNRLATKIFNDTVANW